MCYKEFSLVLLKHKFATLREAQYIVRVYMYNTYTVGIAGEVHVHVRRGVCASACVSVQCVKLQYKTTVVTAAAFSGGGDPWRSVYGSCG